MTSGDMQPVTNQVKRLILIRASQVISIGSY